MSLRADDLLKRLQAQEEVNNMIGTENRALWRPEFAAYMVEGTPGVPYGGNFQFNSHCLSEKIAISSPQNEFIGS